MSIVLTIQTLSSIYSFVVKIQVYSVVNGIVSLKLIKQSHPADYQININHWLIDKGYAQEAEESYLSRVSALWSNINALN
jgi:hypothetical protein